MSRAVAADYDSRVVDHIGGLIQSNFGDHKHTVIFVFFNVSVECLVEKKVSTWWQVDLNETS